MELGEKDFSTLPSSEVNEHLIRMLAQIPTVAAGSEGEDLGERFQETFLRRRGSDTLKALKAALTNMNKRSVASTDAGKEYMLMAFEEAYCVGNRDLILWATQEVNNDPAGFYSENEETVREIERKGYKKFSSRLLNHSAYLEEKFGEGISPDNNQVVFAANWRNQFIDKFKIEP